MVPVTSVSTQLPAGIQSYNYAITLTATAYDIYNAGSNASTFANVTIDSNVDITSYLNDNLAVALQSGDVNAAFQVINNVASVVNIVNCSFTSTAYCNGRNRQACSSTPQLCGSCKTGFLGVSGDSNKKCLNASLPFPSTCSEDDDCLYGLCTDGLCVTPQKTCPTLVPGSDCSGAGICNLLSINGKPVTDCKITNAGCYAACSCNTGYSGIACELDPAAAVARDQQRGVLCGAVSSINSASDPSSSGLDSLASSLSASFNPYETISQSTSSLCQTALSTVALSAGSGYLSSSTPDTASTLVSTVASFVYGQKTNGSSRFYENAVGNITSGISQSLADLQSSQIATENLQVTVRRDLITDVENITYTTPLTDAMSQYGNQPPSLSIGASSYSSLDSGSGYAKVSLLSWARNPYANSTIAKSPILRIGSESRGSDRRTSSTARVRKMIETGYFDGVPNLPVSFLFTVQFSEQQQFNFSANRTALEQEALGNNTFPSCTSYSVDSSSFGACDNCAPISYTNNNVTIACFDIEQIATVAASTGVLDDDAAAVDDYANFDQSFTSKQFAAIFQDVGLVVASVLSSNPFNVNIKQAKVVLSFVGSLAAVLLVGSIYFVKQDEQEDEDRRHANKQQRVRNSKKKSVDEAYQEVFSANVYDASRAKRIERIQQRQRSKYGKL